jgi:hypothetical protein
VPQPFLEYLLYLVPASLPPHDMEWVCEGPGMIHVLSEDLVTIDEEVQ